jgi:hypothetical protein
MRSRIACTALAAILVTSGAAAQSEEPQLPPEIRKPAPIIEVPLPDAPPPVVEKRAPPPVVEKPAPRPVVEKPKPLPAPPAPIVEKRAPAPAAVAPPPAAKPRGECVIKPVMSDDDLYNCGALR